jgi:DHA1 family bicyclomycin/chloramphenicol resistance-like MFS transporter
VAHLVPGTFALTILLAFITAIGPLATDMYLPALPAIRDGLSATTAATQATLSSFLIGFALAQLFYGPVSDRKGRRPAMLFGLALFTAGSLACALAPNVEFLIVARVVQALGGAGSVVLARAMVRDAFEGAQAGRELSRMGSIMAIVPALAPILGAFLAAWAGWRSVFYFMALAGPALAAAVWFRLPETLATPLASRFSLAAMLADFRHIGGQRVFRFYALIASFSFAGFFCFLSGSSFVLQSHFGLNETAFSLVFLLTVLGYMAGATLAQRLVMRIGIDATIRRGVSIIVPATLVMLGLMATGIGGPWPIILSMPFYQLGFGLVLSQCNAGAMLPFRAMAGSASSLFSVTQMSLSALAGGLVGLALDHSVLALPIGISTCAALAALVLAVGRGDAADMPAAPSV